MDENLNKRISQFLQLEKPTDDQIIDGARMLLQLSPGRYRGIYNSAMIRPQSMLPWVRTDLKKQLGIRNRGLTVSTVGKYNKETIRRVRESLSTAPLTVMDKKMSIPTLGTRGKREDHDKLPEEIQALWEKNTKRWQTMSRMHHQLALMVAKPDYAECDGNELCYQLRQLDDALRKDYERYDNYQLSSSSDRVEVFTDNVRTVQNARKAISTLLSRKKPHTEESLRKLQDAINTLGALRQRIKPKTAEKLEALGIKITTSVDAQGKEHKPSAAACP